MLRAAWLALVALCALLAESGSSSLTSTTTTATANEKTKKKNIVFLMCDSMDGRVLDPSSPIAARVATPTFDSLAAQGVNFVRTYAPSPQCVPGRVAMLTSLRPDQSRSFDNGNGLAAEPDGRLDRACLHFYSVARCSEWAGLQRVNGSMFDLLADHADVVVFGKIDMGANAQFRFGPGHTAGTGFHSGPTLATLTRAADIRRPTKLDPLDPHMLNQHDDEVHPEDWKTIDQCLEWIRMRRKQDNFFLHCSLMIPHPPFQTNATWLGANVSKVEVPVWSEPGSLDEGRSPRMHPFNSYQSATKAMSREYNASELIAVRATYYAMCAETDYLMGRVVESLVSSDFWEDSFVVFTSDHGEMNMEHRQVWKNSMYEASARVPLIISGGALPLELRGSTVKSLVTILDILPTFLDLLKVVENPRRPRENVSLAGYSLAGFLGEPPAVWRRNDEQTYVVSQYHSNMANTASFMVRSGDWKLIRFGTGTFAYFADYEPLLFNLREDPGELLNKAVEEPGVVRELEAMLRRELGSGANRISDGGDPEEVDLYAQRDNMRLYREVYLDPIAVKRKWDATLACLRSRPPRREDPDLDAPCANYFPTNASLNDDDTLRRLFEAEYSGFDNDDMANVQRWLEYDL